jgi:acyl-CoA dehydrogenase
MNFTLSAELRDLQSRLATFLRSEVIPAEKEEIREGELPGERLTQLRGRARTLGLWLPQLSPEWGGLGLDTLGMCVIFEEAGYSPLGPVVLNCAAPDEGNMHLLERAGTPEQRDKYLRPLAEGQVRSCFALTEPAPGAGSDPTMLLTRAEKRQGQWAISGRKWFATGAEGAAFVIVAARTDPDQSARRGTTLFLVDARTSGFEVVRPIPTMGSDGLGGHGELNFTDCVVSDEQRLGPEGEGFRLMQVRLGPARLTHCMRWLGAARRAVDIATDYARCREAFGKRLADHQAIQWMVADSAIELHAARLMVWEAAWKLDQGEQARQETSMCKVFVSEAVGRVIDRCLQVCGARGFSRDLLLERFYRDVRAFRIYDGPSEVHRMVIARERLREPGGLRRQEPGEKGA